MTNLVRLNMTQNNDEAFEKWLKENYPDYPPPLSEVLQAATKASEQRITELQAHVNQLREALEIARDYQFYANQQFHIDFEGYKEDEHAQYDADLANTDKALSSTPAQSLAEHDNEIIHHCADTALYWLDDDEDKNALIRNIVESINKLKATP